MINILLGILLGAIICTLINVIVNKKKKREYIKLGDSASKLNEFYIILLRWLKIYQCDKRLSHFLYDKGYRSVAIYGMKELGESLLNELDNSEINVAYCIDKNAESLYIAKDIYTPDMELPKVDAIIITAVHYYDEIEFFLRKRVDCPLISLDDLIWEVNL